MMTTDKEIDCRPVALSVAGSDSGGGAGIQADLKAFSYFDVFGTTAITAVTAQNPDEVTAIYPLAGAEVKEQIMCVSKAFQIKAAKSGMLFNADIIRALADTLSEWRGIPFVCDPVMVAGSGARLLREEAVDELVYSLLPQAEVLTPNIPEAEILTKKTIIDEKDALQAADELAQKFECAVLLKGGHRTTTRSVDFLVEHNSAYRLSSPLAKPPNTHGSGCAVSAALTACLALENKLKEAAVKAKAYIYGSLQNCLAVGTDTWTPGIPKTLPVDDITVSRL